MIVPVGDRLLIEQLKQEVKTSLVLTEETRIRYPKGRIVRLGAPSPQFNEGDVVCFNDLTGEQVTDDDGAEYLVVKFSDIIAKYA